jgi:protein-disulfide isomerase
VLGQETAPLTIYMFSNYTCSICNSFFNENFPKIENEYIKTGKIKFVIKLVPSNRASGSVFKAKSVICAFHQQKFSELHNYLTSPENDTDSAQVADYISKNLGLDIQLYKKCIEDKELDNYLIENKKVFRNHRIKGTPAFIINDNVYLGNKSITKFEEIINGELKKLDK